MKKHFKKAREIAKEYGVRVYFRNAKNYDCSLADPNDRTIQVLYGEGVPHFWSTFFHELAHIYCADNNLYKKYNTNFNKLSKKYLRKIVLRAERFCDKIGAKLMKSHNFSYKYEGLYEEKWVKEWIYNRLEL